MPHEPKHWTPEELLQEAQSKWDDYQIELHHLQVVTFNEIINRSDTTQTIKRMRNEIKQRQGCGLVIQHQLEPTLETRVRCNNSRYYFDLKRTDGATLWTLMERMPLNSESFQDPHQQRIDISLIRVLAYNLQVENHWLPELVKEKEFKIIDIQASRYQDMDAVIVQYEYNPTQKKNNLLRNGQFTLLPGYYWTLAATDVFVEDYQGNRGELKQVFTTIEYGTRKIPIMKKRHQTTQSLSGTDTVYLEVTTQYEIVEALPPPESAFTLSAFGIPDVLDRPATHWLWSAWWLWCFLAALVCLAVAGAVRWLN